MWIPQGVRPWTNYLSRIHRGPAAVVRETSATTTSIGRRHANLRFLSTVVGATVARPMPRCASTRPRNECRAIDDSWTAPVRRMSSCVDGNIRSVKGRCGYAPTHSLALSSRGTRSGNPPRLCCLHDEPCLQCSSIRLVILRQIRSIRWFVRKTVADHRARTVHRLDYSNAILADLPDCTL